MKKCSKCGVEKPLNEFNKDSQKKDGLTSKCRSCWKFYYIQNLEYFQQYHLETYDSNKATLNYEANRDYHLEYNRKYYINNTTNIKLQVTKWNKENYPKYRYKQRWRALLQTTLKHLNSPKDTTTQNLLGYSALELKEHLDKQEIDWGKHHIDHKIPLSWFKKDTPPHIVNDLRNLQPLTEEENKEKLNRFASSIDDSYINEVKKWLKKKYVNHKSFTRSPVMSTRR